MVLSETSIGRIVIKFDTNIHILLRLDCSTFVHILTFHLTPSSGQMFSVVRYFGS